MKPTRPRLDVTLGSELTIAKEQPPYLPLVAHAYGTGCFGSPVVTRWRFTWRDRLAILFGRDLFVKILTFGGAYPPIHLGLEREEFRYLTSDEHAAKTRSLAARMMRR